ncbi:hypothetical protein VPH35_094257 [Triticum aestivum]
MAKAAASLLPGLLPIPPTKPCLIILPASFASKPNPKPGRADSVERWDAHKKDKRPTSPASSCSSSSTPGRASSCERWDLNKQFSGSSRTSSSSSSSSRPSSTSPGGRWDSNKRLPHSRTTSADRWDTWDINKHISGSSCMSSSSSRQSSTSSGGASPCGRRDSNKQLPPSRTTSADRLDTHKKPLPAQASAEIWMSDKDKEQEDDKTATVLKPTVPRIGPMFSGPSFLASPDPSMLPMPAFFRSRNPGVLPVQAF